MADKETRVVLVKPGDVLLVGNVGGIENIDALREAGQTFDALGITAVLFAEDIDIAAVTP